MEFIQKKIFDICFSPPEHVQCHLSEYASPKPASTRSVAKQVQCSPLSVNVFVLGVSPLQKCQGHSIVL